MRLLLVCISEFDVSGGMFIYEMDNFIMHILSREKNGWTAEVIPEKYSAMRRFFIESDAWQINEMLNIVENSISILIG